MRRLIITSLLASVLLTCVFAPSVSAVPQPVYFWESLAQPVKSPYQPAQRDIVRPSKLFVFADGSWVLEKLQWSHWGSSVTSATGISSASNGIPSEAAGKRIKTAAQITLSSPGRLFGHEVYRCYAMKVPAPATSGHGCLSDTHGVWIFMP